jgi:CSLREA domain-containing protein
LIIVLLFIAFVVIPPQTTLANNITVDSYEDTLIDGDGNCTLREAINNANSTTDADTTGGDCAEGDISGEDTIILPAGIYTLEIPGVGENNNETGDLDITSTVTINGAGPDSIDTIIQAGTDATNGIDRVIHATGVGSANGNLTLDNVTVRFGMTDDTIHGGAGIFNEQSTVTIYNSTITENTATGFSPGGGISSNGSLTIENSAITLNHSSDGGGIVILAGSTSTLNNVTLSGNTVTRNGGALWATNSTFNLNHVTLVNNHSASPGGTAGIQINALGNANVRNSIIAGNTNNTGVLNCTIDGSLTSLDYNLEDADTCGLDQTNDMPSTQPDIGQFLNNSGPTATHSLLFTSPALDAIPASTNCCGTTYTADQRGVPRPTDGNGDSTAACDIGAFELVSKLWDGGGGDGLWTTSANWFPNGMPAADELVLLNTPTETIITLNTSTTIAGFVLAGNAVTLSKTDSNQLNVTGEFVHSAGVLRETQSVDNDAIEFLFFDDGAANEKYKGAEIETTNNLGNVTVSIRAVDRENTYCTEQLENSPPYANRCYEIIADNNNSATITLWALANEVDETIDIPRVFRFVDPTWIELLNASDGIDGDYIYAQADTPGFSDFLIAQEGEAPTAITLTNFSASVAPSTSLLPLGIALLAGFVGLGLFWLHRRTA